MAGFLSTNSTCLLCHPALLFPPYPFAMAFIGGALLPVPRPSAAGTHIRRCCWTAPSPASARRRAPVSARRAATRCRPVARAGGGTGDLYPEPEPYVPPPPTVPGRGGDSGGAPQGTAPPAGADLWTSSPSSGGDAAAASSYGSTAAASDVTTTPVAATAGVAFDTAAASASLWRFGWIAWWSQFILTVIAGVILVFSFAFPGVAVASSASKIGTLLAAVGVATSLVSNVWTYGYTRLSLSLGRAAAAGEAVKAAADTAASIRRRLRVGVGLAMVGLTVSLLGVQAIVGTLLARLLSSGLGESYGTVRAIGRVPGGVQPVDILVVQAAANGMLGLVCALGVSLWLTTRIDKWARGIAAK